MPKWTKDKPAEPLPWHLTVLRHTDVIVIAATAVGVMHLRSSHALVYSLGSMATSFSGASKGLKRIIKQPRPEGSYNKRTHGMPSTHSSSITFMGLQPPPTSDLPTDASDLPVRLAYALASLSVPAVVMWSRVALGLHTPAQCAAGALLGTVNALSLFTSWNGLRSFGVPTSASSWLPQGLWTGLGNSFGSWADDLIKQAEEDLRRRWLK
ncbi:hypothetical protein OC845_002855 [Tilletia horrida]|nr:hypothetical protein OC845_002855 [Tilletia horrida]